jgi:hypothetical protein
MRATQFVENINQPIWRWDHDHCQNDNTYNIVENEYHGSMNKNDPSNPTLSYGLLANYRCYQLNELISTWTADNNFIVPDYHPRNQGIDPTTNRPYASKFPLQSMHQLQQLLSESKGYNVELLSDLITKILKKKSTHNVTALREEYNNLAQGQRYFIKLFVAWIFLYGMWMRFWKGPGYDWAYDPRDTNVCIPSSRDEHILLQNNVYLALRDKWERVPILAKWIKQLPTVDYNFTSKDVEYLPDTMIHTIDQFLSGIECMGLGGDIFLQTGYYLITSVLDEDLDTFLSKMLPPLLSIERQIVTTQLSPGSEIYPYIQAMNHGTYIDEDIRDKIRVLNERNYELNQSTIQLAAFDPTKIVKNKHINRF